MAVVALVAASALTATALRLRLGLGGFGDDQVLELDPASIPVVGCFVGVFELADKCGSSGRYHVGSSEKVSPDGHGHFPWQLRVGDDNFCVGQRISHPSVVKQLVPVHYIYIM